MTNEKKQTAVDYHSEKISKLILYAIAQKIDGLTFVKMEKKIYQEAKEMQKKQMIEFALYVLMEARATFEGNVTTDLTIEEYYEIYKK